MSKYNLISTGFELSSDQPSYTVEEGSTISLVFTIAGDFDLDNLRRYNFSIFPASAGASNGELIIIAS